ncbi:MAG: DUF4349 domain-containing protein [Spirochaetaceae bacterium]|nr:DUF4349 domain-containing protein [Spirochaetaceae bacterium]
MKTRAIILAGVLLSIFGGVVVAEESTPRETLAISVTFQLIASDSEMTGRSIAEWADAVGGYFTFRSEQQVLIRIPPRRVPELRKYIEDLGDTVVSYNPSALDYREEMARNNAAINSRTEALDRILIYLDEADVTATLSFERELRSLLQEIEYYTGRSRRIRNEVAFASATINLSSRQRTIPEQRPSTFEWINTVDLYRFLREARP